MKFKVCELWWGVDFSSIIHQIPKEEYEPLIAPEEVYKLELKFQKKDKHYDGPLRYIRECEDPGFPVRTGIQYCVRVPSKKNEYWKKYKCYCYQIGRWWEFIDEMDTINSDFYVPQFISEYDYDNIKLKNTRILNEKAKNDFYHHRHQKELRKIGRDMAKWRLQINKD